MRRPVVVPSLWLAFCLLAVAVGSPLAPAGPVAAQSAADSAVEPDDELGLAADEGLSDDELEAVVERAMVRVETIRGITFEEQPPVTVVTREQFRREYATGGGEPTEAQAAFENARLQALFLVGGDEDATATRAENQNTSVAGFYAPSSGEIVVVSGNERPRLNELTLAHELVHAHQDQRWGLDGYDARIQDGESAQLGLIEGDAVYVETLYERRCETDWECLIPPDAGPGETDQPPRPANLGLLLLDYTPYDAGPAFVEAVHETGGWTAVDALYDDPPRTTEQLIDPDAYPNEGPREVTIEDTNGGDWRRVEPEGRPDHGRLGMAAITTMFVNPLYDSGGQQWVVSADEWFTYDGEPPAYGMFNYGTEYATGWAGDRLHVYRNGDEIGYVWRLAWDSRADAATFADGFDELLAYWGAERVEGGSYRIDDGGYEGAYRVDVDGDTVTVVHAPDTDALSAVSENAEPDTAESTDGDDESAPAEDLPGFGVVVALAALAAGGILLARRR